MWTRGSVLHHFWTQGLHERLGAVNLGIPEGTAPRDVVSDIAMLRLLSVTDFATIEQLDIELGPGFNVLTGETGAGKSIIVDALDLLLGDAPMLEWYVPVLDVNVSIGFRSSCESMLEAWSAGLPVEVGELVVFANH